MEYYDYSPRLQKQRSCSCAPLDAGGGWSNSRRIMTAGFGRIIGNDYVDVDDEFDPLYFQPSRPTTTVGKGLRGLWRRIMKEKRRIFGSSRYSVRSQVPYDPDTYAQNFDEGSVWDVEPENLSRSFSARFAARASVFQRFG